MKPNKILSVILNINEHPVVLQLRNRVARPLGRLLVGLGVGPTILNIIGLVTGILAAFLVGSGHFHMAALALLLSGLADVMDGTVARMRGVESAFGAYFDSVCDRYVDTAIFLGVAWYFMQQQAPLYVFLGFLGLVGTVVTSYARARAESLSMASRYVGFMNRPERVLLLLVGFIMPNTLPAIVWILAVLTNLTAAHRVLFYAAQFRAIRSAGMTIPRPVIPKLTEDEPRQMHPTLSS